jgi:predicted  nucleic acid-binding Zn-ribbon protein
MTSIGDRIGLANEALSRSQERLNTIKTNREYDAVHAEIESSKAVVAGGQEQLKSAGAEIESLSNLQGQSLEHLEKVKAEHEPLIEELKQKIASIDSRIEEVVVERNRILPLIPKHFLSAYEFIRKRRKDGRVLSVIDDNRTCTVCFKRLEPQMINEIKRGVKMPGCQSCGSLLIWHESIGAGQSPQSNSEEPVDETNREHSPQPQP